MKTYNHAYAIAFSVSGSVHELGDDVTATAIRTAIRNRLNDLSGEELKEAVGVPIDTYEEEQDE